MKFLVDVQGLREEPYELPKNAYNHTKRNSFTGEDGRSVTTTELLYNYFDGRPVPTSQRLIGREMEFEGFLEVEIPQLRQAVWMGHTLNNWQPMVDMLAPQQCLKRNEPHDPVKQ